MSAPPSPLASVHFTRSALAFALATTAPLALGACGGIVAEETKPAGTASTAPDASPSAPSAADAGASADVSLRACPTQESRPLEGLGVLASMGLGRLSLHFRTAPGALGREVLAGAWSNEGWRLTGPVPSARGDIDDVRAVSPTTWATFERRTDAFGVLTLFRGSEAVGRADLPLSNDRSREHEGLSPDGKTLVFGLERDTFATSIGRGAEAAPRSSICGRNRQGLATCELLDAKSGEVLLVRGTDVGPRRLERRSFDRLDTADVSVVDPTEDRQVVAVTRSRIFLDTFFGGIEGRVLVLDRRSLEAVAFELKAGLHVLAARERNDGTFDLMVTAGASSVVVHVDAAGKVLASRPTQTFLSRASSAPCGFWASETLFPYADALE